VAGGMKLVIRAANTDGRNPEMEGPPKLVVTPTQFEDFKAAGVTEDRMVISRQVDVRGVRLTAV
jgi:hypothetical protein